VEDKKCIKCNGIMEKGLVPDQEGGLSAYTSPKWTKKVKLFFWLEDSSNIITYRCKSCGYLESYAK
jgi:predicted nucleic-acid-binding Zn-ribbon protein